MNTFICQKSDRKVKHKHTVQLHCPSCW